MAFLNAPPAAADAAAPRKAPNVLAYIQGGDVWVKELPDGEPERLTTDGQNRSPRWSASGEWIAFVKTGAGESPQGDQLWVVRKSGTDARALLSGGLGVYAGQIQTFQWSPTADELAFVTGTGDLHIASDPIR